jgi:hypothetical protein
MTEPPGANRYRQLFVQFGEASARALIDTLQVLALTQPETVRELEAFLDRNSVSTDGAHDNALDPPEATDKSPSVQKRSD